MRPLLKRSSAVPYSKATSTSLHFGWWLWLDCILNEAEGLSIMYEGMYTLFNNSFILRANYFSRS